MPPVPGSIKNGGNSSNQNHPLSVDDRTDALMQEIIRAEFMHHTVISVAHRLDTIIDFDRVVVLDKGRVVEVGKPADLLADSSRGWFKELWEVSRRERETPSNREG